MKDKATVRYIGYRTLADGGRGFEFSIAAIGETKWITVEAPGGLFRGPERIAVQEGPAICYETLTSRIESDTAIPNDAFSLSAADVAQHRRSSGPASGAAKSRTWKRRDGSAA
jgi:hypothetical protein